jgi:hypothetical protein
VATEITIDPNDLRVGSYYWARPNQGEDLEIVQVSDVFGSDREYWTVAVMGSDQHRSLKDFEFLIRLMRP